MNSNATGLSFKRKLGIAACVVIVVHILFCVLLIVLPSRIVHSNFLTSAYKNLMVVGPFFYEAPIKSSSLLQVKVYANGSWSPIEGTRRENFHEYQRQPWRYDLLIKNDFEEYAANQIKSLKKKEFEFVKRSKPFRELNQFILRRHPGEIDSISMIYLRKIYSTESNQFEVQTIFSYIYSPHEIGPGKH